MEHHDPRNPAPIVSDSRDPATFEPLTPGPPTPDAPSFAPAIVQNTEPPPALVETDDDDDAPIAYDPAEYR